LASNLEDLRIWEEAWQTQKLKSAAIVRVLGKPKRAFFPGT